MSLPYKRLINIIKRGTNYKLVIKKEYSVLLICKNFHISIFQDQWDNYEKLVNMPYYLFHVSSNESTGKCSTYFWVDKETLQIKNIPDKFFKYESETYDHTKSTRSKCKFIDIKPSIKKFQKILLIAKYSDERTKRN
jgi:hypothetical protein